MFINIPVKKKKYITKCVMYFIWVMNGWDIKYWIICAVK